MQREIKFRGKRLDNGEWAYGAFVPDELEQTHGKMVTWGFIRRYKPNRTVESVEMIEVDRNTVGQYTGLKDKNGKEIYDGDILWCDLGWKYAVEWDEEEGRFIGYTLENERKIVYVNRDPKSEVIGNIYDNPELLQEVE